MTAMNFKGQQGQGKHGGSWDTTDDGEWHYWWFWFRQLKEAFYNFVLSFFVRARCLSAGLRSWVLLADQRESNHHRQSVSDVKNAAIPTEPRGRLQHTTMSFCLVAWLFAAKRRRISLCSLRWEFAGFRAGGRLPFEWLYWILCCPLLGPLAPLDSYRSFQRRKNMNYDLFSQSCQISWVRGGMVEKRANRGKKEF